MLESQVHTVAMGSPSDTGSVDALFERGLVDPAHVVALIAQTEGDGYARGYAALAFQLSLARALGVSQSDVADAIPMLMIGGTAGLMSPHVTLFVKRPVSSHAKDKAKRLAIGVASTRALKPEEYGRTSQVELVAAAVRAAMKDADIGSTDDVACVELKCPQMTGDRMADALSRGRPVADSSPSVASAMSRGASALGAAVALGEVRESEIADTVVGRRRDLFTKRASASSGSEQDAVRVVVLGNVEGAPGHYVAAHSVMEHQLDLVGARKAFVGAGLRIEDGVLVPADRPKLAATFVNAGADYLPHCLGRRHTMGSDLLAHASGHLAKAVAHATIAGITQDPLFLCSAGAEHQGQPGSNLICVVANHGARTSQTGAS
jgi:cyanuric acid amidohydrolase